MRLACVLPVMLAGCAPLADPRSPPTSDEHLIALLFEDARSIENQLARDFACVSLRYGVADRDPPPGVIDALRSRWKVPVVAGSRCSIGEASTVAAPGVTGTGKWLRITNFQCPDADHCTADVSYYVANLGAGGRSVAIERTRSGWRITPTGAMWIS
ncbi:MAG TPA: hypothetical protein VJM15_09695 [Sphingomicrobium sp.]|nr:hypothetical protein [Sphingomicrobium sp.]